jgi:outer membrane lipopolysaccharide assembly protein LptE/RlpB
MYRIRLLILLLSLISLAGCGYSFVLDKNAAAVKVALEPSSNETSLREAGMILDSNLERVLASMGILDSRYNLHFLQCTLVSTSKQNITSTSLSSSDRYRLIIRVSAKLMDAQGKKVWSSTFTDEGTYSQGGQPEDALDQACSEVSQQIALALVSLRL